MHAEVYSVKSWQATEEINMNTTELSTCILQRETEGKKSSIEGNFQSKQTNLIEFLKIEAFSCILVFGEHVAAEPENSWILHELLQMFVLQSKCKAKKQTKNLSLSLG